MSSMRRQTPSGTPLPPRMKEAQAYIRTHTREKVKLTSFDGLELAALYLPVERPRGTVIAFHGYRSLATIDFALEVEFLHRLGYDVLLPYQRSHGESQGKYITYGGEGALRLPELGPLRRPPLGGQAPVPHGHLHGGPPRC